MSEQRSNKLIFLQKQPGFPMEDLSDSNTEMLKYILPKEVGLDVYAQRLEAEQQHIHQIANQAMRLMHIPTEYSPAELRAFSHGFASFETISDLLHEPRIFDNTTAVKNIASYLVDTRSLADIERERKTLAPNDTAEEETLPTDDAAPYHMVLTPSMESALSGVPNKTIDGPTTHDALNPEQLFVATHTALPKNYPNTYDLLVTIGEVRNETLAQLQLRIAGASLARALQAAV